MKVNQSDSFLLIGLEAQPVVVVTKQDFPKGVLYKGTFLKEIEFERGFLGFYDWLRDVKGRCFGVRVTLHKTSLAAGEILPLRDYIVREGEGILSIRLAVGEEDPEMSVDQEFSASRIYVGETGAAVLLFDASLLDESELRSLSSDGIDSRPYFEPLR